MQTIVDSETLEVFPLWKVDIRDVVSSRIAMPKRTFAAAVVLSDYRTGLDVLAALARVELLLITVPVSLQDADDPVILAYVADEVRKMKEAVARVTPSDRLK